MAKRSKDDREPVEDEPEGTEDAPGGEESGEQGPGRARRLGRRVGGRGG